MMARTQIQLTTSRIKSLRRLSAATGRSVAELVRQGWIKPAPEAGTIRVFIAEALRSGNDRHRGDLRVP